MVSLLVHLSKILDRVVNKVFLLQVFYNMEVEVLKVSLDVIFAFIINVWLINQSQSLYHNCKTAVETSVLNLLEAPSERIEDLNSSFTEFRNCQRDENVLLQISEDSDPLVSLFFQKLILL